jgi:hypothetical protein
MTSSLGASVIERTSYLPIHSGLQAGGLARGEALSEAEAVYLIDNGLATGRRP